MASPVNFAQFLDPTRSTAVLSHGDGRAISQGRQPAPGATTAEQQQSKLILDTVEGLKQFFFDKFKFVGTDGRGDMPAFFVNWKVKNAAYRQNQAGEKCFSFHSQYITPDVIAHEYTHAVVAALVGSGGLGNAGEAGALNESVADVFAAVFARSNYTKENWTIHDRDLSAHFGRSQILDTRPSDNNDSGNIHHNSRLVSYGFVLSSAKLQEEWRFRRDEAEMSLLNIWWPTIQELTPEQRTLVGFAKKTVEIAKRGKGEGWIQPEAEALDAVWNSIFKN